MLMCIVWCFMRRHIPQPIPQPSPPPCAFLLQSPGFYWPSQLGRTNPIYWFFGGKGLGIQQGTSSWVGSPKSLFVSLFSFSHVTSSLASCNAINSLVSHSCRLRILTMRCVLPIPRDIDRLYIEVSWPFSMPWEGVGGWEAGVSP